MKTACTSLIAMVLLITTPMFASGSQGFDHELILLSQNTPAAEGTTGLQEMIPVVEFLGFEFGMRASSFLELCIDDTGKLVASEHQNDDWIDSLLTSNIDLLPGSAIYKLIYGQNWANQTRVIKSIPLEKLIKVFSLKNVSVYNSNRYKNAATPIPDALSLTRVYFWENRLVGINFLLLHGETNNELIIKKILDKYGNPSSYSEHRQAMEEGANSYSILRVEGLEFLLICDMGGLSGNVSCTLSYRPYIRKALEHAEGLLKQKSIDDQKAQENLLKGF